MKRSVLALLGLVSLAGCASVQPYYEAGNYQPQPWATMSFEQARANCRADHLEHHFMGDTYELEVPPYKACMEKNGYRFAARQ